MTGWTCARCDQPLDAHHDWHGCPFPEPGMETLTGLHAVLVTGAPHDTELRVLHPAGCSDRTCPIVHELADEGPIILHPDYPHRVPIGWEPGNGVHLVQAWAVAGTRSPFALAPLEWDAGMLTHARLLFTSDSDAGMLTAANLEGHPWR